MPDFGTSFGSALLQVGGSTLTVSPQGIGPTAGSGLISATGATVSIGGGELSPAAGNAFMQAPGASIDMDTYLGDSRGVAFMGAAVDPDGITVDAPLPRNTDEAVLLVGTGYGILRSEIKRLSLVDVALQVYSLWGYQLQGVGVMQGYGLASIVMWINAAMQTIFSRADRLDYFNRVEKTLTVPPAGLALDVSLQKLLGPVCLVSPSRQLRPLVSRSEYQQFVIRFMGDNSVQPSAPIAYFLDTKRADAPDSVGSTLFLVPSPDTDTAVRLDVCEEPPRYDALDIAQGVGIEIPHRWAETLLIPLVKKWAMADSIMPASGRQAVEKEVNEQFERAMAILGLADPAEPAVNESKPKGGTQPA